MKIVANMMVLNERPFLSEVIPALHRFVDRIVIVDNGSVDYSRDLLMDHLLYPEDDLIFARQDDPPDFGKQRNIALDATEQGAWVLKWDADELPSDKMITDLRPFLEKDDRFHGWAIGCYHILKHPKKALPFEYGFQHLCLFKNRPGVRWSKGTHEQIQGVGGPQGGINPARTGIAIIHFSYWCETRFKRKAQAYAKIPDSGFRSASELTNRLASKPKPLPDTVTYKADPEWLEEIRRME